MLNFLYKKLLKFYPHEFREQLAESMEQTFKDRYVEIRNAQQGLFGFAIWTFTETTIGIFKEHLLHGDIMQTTLKKFGVSALISFLFILPFLIMEIVNRRNFNEDFPYALFFGLWANLFAVSLILLPIALSRWSGKQGTNSISMQRNSLLTNPKSTLIISIVLIFIIVILSLLSSLGWKPMEGLNAEYVSVFGIQVPSVFIALALFLLPITAGYIASVPIFRTLQTGGSLFAHPFHLIIVAVLSFFFLSGVVTLIIDQWPCFIGVPVCD